MERETIDVRVPELEAFLAETRTSASAAYAAFRGLLSRLDDPETRPRARRLLEELTQWEGETDPRDHHFRFRRLELPTRPGGDDEELVLLELPGIFTPEEWSFTFFEGLIRYPESTFRDRDLVELGCGNGWVTLALARAVSPRTILGLDVNPRAVRCSRLNLYLNGLEATGEPRIGPDGRSLLERVRFEESDLLEVCRRRRDRLDFVLGCIPQVLNVDPDETVEAVSETADEAALYALSNYYERQGYVEDQFGLGLIARAVEESFEVLRPEGAVILNLGGRPGAHVLERLFRRRGLSVHRVWQTRVEQAGDTDIEPLVEVERRTRHRFEFFMGPSVETPISARTAQRYLRAGGSIFHRLAVVEARMEFPSETQRLFESLRGPEHADVRSYLDLEYPDREVAAEKVAFLARLAERLAEATCFPYDETAGRPELRSHLADYLRLYHRVPADAEQFVVLPSRVEALTNLLEAFRPSIALVDAELVGLLGGEGMEGPTEIVEAPRSLELVVELVRRLRPQCVVTALADFEARSTEPLERLLEVTREVGALVVLDLSAQFELSSTPSPHAALRYLERHRLPPHAAILCGLVKNRVYEDLELAFLFGQSGPLVGTLTDIGELTYSRVPWLHQLYYECLLDELLRFQLRERRLLSGDSSGGLEDPDRTDGSSVEAFAPVPDRAVVEALEHPAVTANHRHFDTSSVRLDYGENSLPSPPRLSSLLLQSFARRRVSDEEADPMPAVSEWSRRRLGYSAGQWVWGHGVAPLFAALARSAVSAGESMHFPAGAYGHFVAAARCLGCDVRVARTRRADGFRWTVDSLDAALHRSPPGAWVFLNAPIANPTGALYTPAEVADLVAVARRRRARVIVDAIFAELHHAGSAPRLDLEGPGVVLLGGVSKLVAAGGLRFGFAGTDDPQILERLDRYAGGTPHWTLRYAVGLLYRELVAADGTVLAALDVQRSTLARRAEELSRVLDRWGWDVLRPEGGLFLVASPAAYRSQTFDGVDGVDPKAPFGDRVVDALFATTGLLINGPTWTGIEDHCRFVLSVTDDEMADALERLEAFGRSFRT